MMELPVGGRCGPLVTFRLMLLMLVSDLTVQSTTTVLMFIILVVVFALLCGLIWMIDALNDLCLGLWDNLIISSYCPLSAVVL